MFDDTRPPLKRKGKGRKNSKYQKKLHEGKIKIIACYIITIIIHKITQMSIEKHGYHKRDVIFIDVNLKS
jgi:hypothetical protein